MTIDTCINGKKKNDWLSNSPSFNVVVLWQTTGDIDILQRMIQHWSMLQCADPNRHVSDTTTNMYTTRNSMHKMWFFTILKPYFQHKNMRQIQIYFDRWVLMTVKLCPIKSKVSSPLKITKLFQFQNSGFSTAFNGCCLPLQTVDIYKYQ